MGPKYQVGDRVIIRPDLHTGLYETEHPGIWMDCQVVSGMLKYAGQAATITEVQHSGRYSIDLDDADWFWVAEMFQGFEDDGTQYELVMDELF